MLMWEVGVMMRDFCAGMAPFLYLMTSIDDRHVQMDSCCNFLACMGIALPYYNGSASLRVWAVSRIVLRARNVSRSTLRRSSFHIFVN